MPTKPPTISSGPATGWMLDGACLNLWWLPWIDNPRHVALDEVRLMRRTCASCPVLDTCAGFVAEQRVTAGFWAGRWRSLWALYRPDRPAAAKKASRVA